MDNQCLELTHYFNHKLILSELDEDKVQRPITCSHNPVNQKVMYNTPFQLNNRSRDDEYGNVACEGQTIEIDPKHYRSISILGFAELGDFSEKWRFVGMDGTQVETGFTLINGYVNDCWGSDDQNCKLAFTAKGDQRNLVFFETNTMYIRYYKSMIPEVKSPITRVIFPNNPNIHILAITLDF